MKKLLQNKNVLYRGAVVLLFLIVFGIVMLVFAFTKEIDKVEYSMQDNGTYEVVDFKNDFRGGLFLDEKFTIYSEYKGEAVTSIKKLASTKIKELVIQEGVKTIKSNAFDGCSNLEKITLPSSLTSIEWGAFANCSSLKEIVIPEGIEIIDESMFSYCYALEKVVLPSTVTVIGKEAFCGCKNLVDINLDNVTSVYDCAFDGCTKLLKEENSARYIKVGSNDYYILYDFTDKNLTSLTINSNVKMACLTAFSNVKKVSSTVEDTIEYYGTETNPYMFVVKANDKKIEDVTINANALYVMPQVFASTTKIKTVTYTGTNLLVGNNNFWFTKQFGK